MWQWGVAKKCSAPPLKFNWIGLLPIQLNLFPNTHIKYSLNAYEITKLPLIQLDWASTNSIKLSSQHTIKISGVLVSHEFLSNAIQRRLLMQLPFPENREPTLNLTIVICYIHMAQISSFLWKTKSNLHIKRYHLSSMHPSNHGIVIRRVQTSTLWIYSKQISLGESVGWNNVNYCNGE